MGVTIPEATLNSISVIIITLILSYFTLVFGELVPKRVAMKKAEKLALGMSALVSSISRIFAPIVWLLTASTNGLLRLLGIDPNEEDEEVTEEEIRMMVDAGSEKGTIDSDEKELIQNVFEFDDLTVEEICTHRTEVSLLWMDESMEQWENTIHDSRHSLYPICNESVDDIVGILDAKDYFRLTEKTRECVMESAVKPAYFVPENIKADVLFRNMKKNGNYFAIVLDEYGGMSGIITIHDLVQQLVGELDDENEIERVQNIEPIDSQTWKILGSTPLEDVSLQLGVDLPTEEFDTFGGFILGTLGSIPDDGSQFEVESNGLTIKVIELREHRVEKAVVCLTKKDVE
jgi:putative hemolysin